MLTLEATGLIKITRIPDGEWPVERRRLWVGKTLPCLPILGYNKEAEVGIVTGKEIRKRYAFNVPQDLAIQVLEKTNPQFAAWIKSQGFPMNGQCFAFDMYEAEIISGVTRQKMYRGFVPGDPLGP